MRRSLSLYLQRRAYSYYFRLTIPKDVRSFYQKHEICFSLKTLDRKTAKTRSIEQLALYSAEFERCRLSASVSPASSTDAPHLHTLSVSSPETRIPIKVMDASSSLKNEPGPEATVRNAYRIEQLPDRHSSASSVSLGSNANLSASGKSLSQVFQMYLSERKPSAGTMKEFNSVVKRFISICGDRDISSYTNADMMLYKQVLLKYPRCVSAKDTLLSVKELLEKYERSNIQRISQKTIKEKYVALLKVIFSYAVDNMLISENPVSKIKIIVPEQIEPPRLPFSAEQIKSIVRHDFWEKHRDEQKYAEYRFIILLAIFTGARLEEICRLKYSDIGIEDGIMFMHIRPDAESGHTLKTASSRRRVPLHPRLLKEFSFEAYYRSRKGNEYLFPTLNGGTVVCGSISHAFSKWFGRFLSNTVGIDDKKLRFHSFRHSFKAIARSNGIEKSIVDCMQGHASGEVSLNYGRDRYGSSYSLRTMLDALMRMGELGGM